MRTASRKASNAFHLLLHSAAEAGACLASLYFLARVDLMKELLRFTMAAEPAACFQPPFITRYYYHDRLSWLSCFDDVMLVYIAAPPHILSFSVLRSQYGVGHRSDFAKTVPTEMNTIYARHFK